jgi:mannose-6-phosphate isomerase-like protein (cupin superfamily)
MKTLSSKIILFLKKEMFSYEKYFSKELKVIGFPGLLNKDCIVKDKLTYNSWIETAHTYPVIKIEGIPFKYVKHINSQIIDIHAFISQKSSISFNWHTDDVNVYLYVLKGKKIVQIKNKTYILTKNQSCIIPKKYIHRVFSKKNTWALSIAIK